MTNKEAIEIISNFIATGCFQDKAIQAFECAIKSLEEERPQGEWIRDKGEYIDYQIYKVAFRCSLCCDKFNSSYNYCPDCGARMKVVRNENR